MPETKIQRGDGSMDARPTCGSCAASETVAGGHVFCRRNPPGRGPTGASLWPIVDPNRDWCLQWQE